MQDMTSKVVFITGASTGIGRAAADRFAAANATVIGTSRWPWRYPTPTWCPLHPPPSPPCMTPLHILLWILQELNAIMPDAFNPS